MNIHTIFEKALKLQELTTEEGLYIYNNASTPELMHVAHEIRKQFRPENKVTWIIDRNVNITNSCIAGCKFCNFMRKPNSDEVYITTIDQYKEKIDELFALGGNQLLMQGGLHPKLGIDFYSDLFRSLKAIYPELLLHALGPPEIAHIARIEKCDHKTVLKALTDAGLDSLPGAGAEILSDRVRKQLSPGKCDSETWLNVMREAHKLNITTSATMMFGHIETKQERIEHLIKIRSLQAERPTGSQGFATFIPWPFQDENTILKDSLGIKNNVSSEEYIRLLAISRIMLNNIANLQASWLTVGKETAQACLHGGANDFGSIMIEENVVSVAGASYKFDADGMQKAIIEAGFSPQRRKQNYEYLV